jgi:hypothetical protein
MGVKEEHLLVTTRAKKYSDFLGYEKRIFIEQGSGRSFRTWLALTTATTDL